MAILLSLVAAVTYGLSDFVGGITSRRVSAWQVAWVSQLGGGAVVLLASLTVAGSPTREDLAWALLAGAGNGIGTAFLYRGLAAGRMGVVAPVSGVGAALLPVVVGVVSGERPGLIAWLGVAIALPAIWLVAREPGAATGQPAGAGLVDGVLAGLGFGTLFVALAQIHEDAGLLPLGLNQFVGAVVIALVAGGLRQSWVPRDPRAGWGALCGVLGATATGLFMLASQQGFLAITAVITSLYPAFTVILAAVLLRERVHGSQGLGLVLCAAAVALVATG